MNQQQKTVKLVENNDLISKLPIEILSQLVSLLPLTEAIKTSTLSKSWKLIWTTQTDIEFDINSVLGIFSNDKSRTLWSLIKPEHVDQFVERVDHIMLQRFTGPNMKSILISFPLSEEHESHVTRWISTAVMKGVVTVILNFDGAFNGLVNFPFSILTAPGQACTIKHLQLASCNLRSLSVTNSLDSLVIVELCRVNLTDEQLDVMLCSCLFLRRFSLRFCPMLESFKLTSRNSRLRFLNINCCFGLRSFELYSESLEIFEYNGLIGHFSFEHVPKLANLFAYVYGAPTEDVEKFQTYALSSIAKDVPRLETLNMHSTSASKFCKQTKDLRLPKGVFTFTKMKYLVLTVRRCDDEDELDWISYILKTFPVLNKLQLDFPQILTSYTRWSNVENAREVLPAAVPHEHLRKIEVNGYHGSRRENEVVKYLVDSAFKLDLLVISSQAKMHMESKSWLRESPEYNHVDKSRSEKIEQLQLVVPKGVRVDYRNL